MVAVSRRHGARCRNVYPQQIRLGDAKMKYDLSAYRSSALEQARSQSLLNLIPAKGGSVLDIGARDGYIAKQLLGRFTRVVALDLERPNIDDPRVEAVQGNAINLQFPDNTFDAIVCAEVLEHIPLQILPRVAQEIARVASSTVVIGVPYEQDLRLACTNCLSCGQNNPPWGHVNAFDEADLAKLFTGLRVTRTEFVGSTSARTNWLAAWLSAYAGNPYGTYTQEEPCIHCGAKLTAPLKRSMLQRVATRAAHWANRAQATVSRPRPNWIHMVFEK